MSTNTGRYSGTAPNSHNVQKVTPITVESLLSLLDLPRPQGHDTVALSVGTEGHTADLLFCDMVNGSYHKFGRAAAIQLVKAINLASDLREKKDETEDPRKKLEAVHNTIRIMIDTYGDDDPEMAIEKIRNLLEE